MTDRSPSPRQITEQELEQILEYDEKLNLAKAEVTRAEASLAIAKGNHDLIVAESAKWRAPLQRKYKLIPGEDDIDYETRLITKIKKDK